MSSLTSDLSHTENTTTIIRPDYFFITGVIGIPNMNYYYFFLCFVYIFSLVSNTFIIIIIYKDRDLHSPKYIAVVNLAFTDVCESTALFPKIIDMFLFNRQFISYDECLTNLFFISIFFTIQSFNLTILSYDRLVAICCPLSYHNIVTHRSIFLLTVIAWAIALLTMLVTVGLVTQVSFCRSLVLNSFYCEDAVLFTLAAPCSDLVSNVVMTYINTCIILYIPMIFIVASYICIIHALFTITRPQDRIRAMKTCTSHLILVAILYLPTIITYLSFSFIPAYVSLINLSLNCVLPPMLNPIVYVLKTEEFKESAKKLLRRVAKIPVGTLKST